MKVVLLEIAEFCFAIAPASGAKPKQMTLHDASRLLPKMTFTDGISGSLTQDAYRGKVMPPPHLGDTVRGRPVALSIDRAGVVRNFHNASGI